MTTTTQTWAELIWDTNRNTRAGILVDAYLGRTLDRAELPAAVVGAWVDQDEPEGALPAGEWQYMFSQAGFTLDGVPGDSGDRARTLYRGASTDRKRRMSWTADVDVALRFASWAEDEGREAHVYTATVEAGRVLARIEDLRLGISEHEYVVNTSGLRITTLV
ncbi:hypothetical protein RCH23_002111 [Cryobacterium sp. CAN_C3]|uniref:hypothetical protein n=1 Tax=unclassified Cryobacterium TaxID=2649013 RepID=UPI0018CB8257|nr:hypothetical protein [Cryobacterium sp. CAN_C3]MEC5154726.1 hypothetical protein [Cryobacterium sp. CAN_C3]